MRMIDYDGGGEGEQWINGAAGLWQPGLLAQENITMRDLEKSTALISPHSI
jgi:hypothetical protein